MASEHHFLDKMFLEALNKLSFHTALWHKLTGDYYHTPARMWSDGKDEDDLMRAKEEFENELNGEVTE
jgi:hypothetical protein